MLTIKIELFLREDEIYRLVVWESDETGAQSIRDIVEGDLRVVLNHQINVLDPESSLRVRKVR